MKKQWACNGCRREGWTPRVGDQQEQRYRGRNLQDSGQEEKTDQAGMCRNKARFLVGQQHLTVKQE